MIGFKALRVTLWSISFGLRQTKKLYSLLH